MPISTHFFVAVRYSFVGIFALLLNHSRRYCKLKKCWDPREYKGGPEKLQV